jgi:ubiquinone/menaquinone biosynthesis C-methylase UbiE
MMLKLWTALVGFGFRLLYNELAWTYDLVSWLASLGEWRAWQRAALPYVVGREVLEVGHGPGHMLLALQNGRFNPTGLDLSPAMGRLARQRTQRTVPLVRGKVQALPFGPATFDTVLATFPTEYVVDPTTLTAVWRVLKDNGRFVIVPEARFTGRKRLQRLMEWLYVITGQRGNGRSTTPATTDFTWQPHLARFHHAGFHIQFHHHTLPRSQVTIIVATKHLSA